METQLESRRDSFSFRALIPAALCQWWAAPPQHRYIHVDAFRYGKDPSVIRCNRGDWLHLTFSSRQRDRDGTVRSDTGHSFFLEEFDLDAKITPGSPDVEVFRTSTPEPGRIQREVVVKAEHPGWLRYLVSKSTYHCHVWCGPMHAFEQGNLIIEPNTLLFAALGLVMGIPVVGWLSLRDRLAGNVDRFALVLPTDGRDLFAMFPWAKTWFKRREFPLVLILVTMAGLYLVILTMLFGTKMAGRNFGTTMTWIVWLTLLTAVLTPLGGRIWCMACPLPMFGDMLQRRALIGVRAGQTRGYKNHFFGLNLAWPRWLANDWPRAIIFLLVGTFSSALVAVPRFSGLVIVLLVVVASLMALIWELRAFCRYLCPVTAFLRPYARLSRLALRQVDSETCRRCTIHSCQLGNEHGWACPFGLCVSDINENTDCGICTECLKSCAYDNVTLRWRGFAHETSVNTYGEAWLSLIMFTMGVAYCLVHLGHWPPLRDCVNIIDKGNWGQFGLFALVLWTTALVLVPGIMFAVAVMGQWLASLRMPRLETMKALTGALLPLGLAIWIAFVVPMFMVNVSFVRQSVSDPFGWGWDFFGTANTPWRQLFPRAIPWIQVAIILLGFYYSLRNAWRIWDRLTEDPRRALRGVIPLAFLLIAVSGSLVWFFAD